MEERKFYLEKYGVTGSVEHSEGRTYYIRFEYEGEIHCIPMDFYVTPKTKPWLMEAAQMMAESYLDKMDFQKQCAAFMTGSDWDEW